MSETRQRILDDIKLTMKAGDKQRLGTLRLISADIKQKEVDERVTLDDTAVLAILDRMTRQRRESVRQYSEAGREDLAAVELAEIDIIAHYLPSALSDAEVFALIDSTIAATGASSIRDMGKVMAQIKPQLQGRADIGAVSQQIKTRLGTG